MADLPSVDERWLVRAWQRGVPGPLWTSDGHRLEIVFRGRCPNLAGPDVRGAILALDGGQLMEGDVEFHRRTSDWYAHGHQHDRRYAGVILHVVLVVDREPPSDSSGQPIPTLVLTPNDPSEVTSAAIPADRGDAERCHRQARERGTADVSSVLDALGDRRLADRAARFEADLTRLLPEQVAYEALFDTLGFSQNRGSFVRLAQAAPIQVVTGLLGRKSPDEALVLAQAILFGVAGLLPSQREQTIVDWEGDDELAEVESVWGLYRPEWDSLRLVEDDWTFGGVRPANYPTRRIATAARLIVRYREAGLTHVFLDPLRSGDCSSKRLEDIFLVEDQNGYWSTHADFGRLLPNGPSRLLGQERARDAAVNVVLPLALAVASQIGDRAMADLTWEIYRSFPRPAAYNQTRRLAAELGAADRLVRSARRQQGLLQLLRNYCEPVNCVGCPLAETDVL